MRKSEKQQQKKEEKPVIGETEAKILKILGNDHIIPCEFYDSTYELRGIYTYIGNVYVLSHYDMPFEEVAEKYQEIILEKIEKGEYKLNKTLH